MKKTIKVSLSFKFTCHERSQWQNHFMQRDAQFTEIYNHMRDYNLAKAGMPGWRDVIGHNVFDNHPHMRFAVEEVSFIFNYHFVRFSETESRVFLNFNCNVCNVFVPHLHMGLCGFSLQPEYASTSHQSFYEVD